MGAIKKVATFSPAKKSKKIKIKAKGSNFIKEEEHIKASLDQSTVYLADLEDEMLDAEEALQKIQNEILKSSKNKKLADAMARVEEIEKKIKKENGKMKLNFQKVIEALAKGFKSNFFKIDKVKERGGGISYKNFALSLAKKLGMSEDDFNEEKENFAGEAKYIDAFFYDDDIVDLSDFSINLKKELEG